MFAHLALVAGSFGLATALLLLALLERFGRLADAVGAAAAIVRGPLSREALGKAHPQLGTPPQSWNWWASGKLRTYRAEIELGSYTGVLELEAFDREEAVAMARTQAGIARVRLIEGAFGEQTHPAVAA